jgi:hypothetical protein
MTHTLFKWGFFVGMPATVYLLWDGWNWPAGVAGISTILCLCASAYTEKP